MRAKIFGSVFAVIGAAMITTASLLPDSTGSTSSGSSASSDSSVAYYSGPSVMATPPFLYTSGSAIFLYRNDVAF